MLFAFAETANAIECRTATVMVLDEGFELRLMNVRRAKGTCDYHFRVSTKKRMFFEQSTRTSCNGSDAVILNIWFPYERKGPEEIDERKTVDLVDDRFTAAVDDYVCRRTCDPAEGGGISCFDEERGFLIVTEP